MFLNQATAKQRCGPVGETTTTVEPTTYCPPQRCTHRNVWDQESCQCVCPFLSAYELCQDLPGECFIDGDCECMCFTTRVPITCIEITCPFGGVRNMETCECEGGTDTPTETTETETEYTNEDYPMDYVTE